MKKAKHGLQEIPTWYSPRLFTSLVGTLLKAKPLPLLPAHHLPHRFHYRCNGPFVHDAITIALYLNQTGLFLEGGMSLQPSRSSPKEHRPGKVFAWCADLPELDWFLLSTAAASIQLSSGCQLLCSSGIAVFLLTGSCYLKLVRGDYRSLHLQCKVQKLLLWSKLLSGPLCDSNRIMNKARFLKTFVACSQDCFTEDSSFFPFLHCCPKPFPSPSSLLPWVLHPSHLVFQALFPESFQIQLVPRTATCPELSAYCLAVWYVHSGFLANITRKRLSYLCPSLLGPLFGIAVL